MPLRHHLSNQLLPGIDVEDRPPRNGELNRRAVIARSDDRVLGEIIYVQRPNPRGRGSVYGWVPAGKPYRGTRNLTSQVAAARWCVQHPTPAVAPV